MARSSLEWSIILRARSRTGRSTIRPSTVAAPPSVRRSKAVTIRRGQRHLDFRGAEDFIHRANLTRMDHGLSGKPEVPGMPRLHDQSVRIADVGEYLVYGQDLTACRSHRQRRPGVVEQSLSRVRKEAQIQREILRAEHEPHQPGCGGSDRRGLHQAPGALDDCQKLHAAGWNTRLRLVPVQPPVHLKHVFRTVHFGQHESLQPRPRNRPKIGVQFGGSGPVNSHESRWAARRAVQCGSHPLARNVLPGLRDTVLQIEYQDIRRQPQSPVDHPLPVPGHKQPGPHRLHPSFSSRISGKASPDGACALL